MRFLSNRDMAVGVADLKTAIQFYEDTLGFKPVQIEPGLRVYDIGHITLYVEQGEPHPPVPSFTVEGLSEARKHLVMNGCNILVERDNSLYFRDPTGNIWDIIED